MKRLFMLFCMSIFVFSGHLAGGQSVRQQRKVVLSVDLKREKQLQAEVDNGHQPWRLEAVVAAHSALVANIDKGIALDKCKLLSEIDREAAVKCKDAKSYTVQLKKLVHAKGIWTATEIQIEE